MKNLLTPLNLMTISILFFSLLFSKELNAQIIISDEISVSDYDDSYGRKSPKIAINADGNIMVFWVRSSPEAFFISTLIDGEFSLPINIPYGDLNPNVWSSSLGPSMAAYGNDVYVAFEIYGEAIYTLHSSDAGETWAEPVAAFTPPAGRKATIPIIAVNSLGQPFVAYTNTNSVEGDAYYGLVKSSDFGSTYDEEVDVSSFSAGEEVCECCNGHIAIDENENIYVSFRNNDNNQRDIWMAISTDGGESFESAYDVDETDWIINSCPSNGPHFTILDDEVVNVFFSGAGSEGSSVYFSSFNLNDTLSGSTFNLPATNEESGNQNRPKVSGSGDTLAVVWQEYIEGSNEIGMSVSTTGSDGLATNSFLVTDLPSTQQYPNILFANDAFHVIYEDSQSGTVLYHEISFGTVGIETIDKLEFNLSPNPAKNELLVVLDSENQVYYDLTVYDLNGRQLMTLPSYKNTSKLDISDIDSGLYLLEIKFKNGDQSIKKFVKY